MANRHVYEVSGRVYIVSGLSSHSWQRGTSRRESGDGLSFVQAYYYQTPSMVEMLHRSQSTSHHRLLILQPLPIICKGKMKKAINQCLSCKRLQHGFWSL
ncbi:hypothetical protein Bca4012_017966 [Brassica carinata]|uniref:VWA-Hint protein Vwaint domain-containing protein n=1 Tax=Brassica carinata TaxID=52824 RepID=A0A8X7WQL6_BRACI|nr:hypothetical protein Bca52824_003638 [Brassica carinata]